MDPAAAREPSAAAGVFSLRAGMLRRMDHGEVMKRVCQVLVVLLVGQASVDLLDAAELHRGGPHGPWLLGMGLIMAATAAAGKAIITWAWCARRRRGRSR